MPYTDIAYRPGDVLMFGQESVGLPEQFKHDPHVTSRVRLPMLPSLRSLNLANAASIAVYEAWRQQGFAGAQTLSGRPGRMPGVTGRRANNFHDAAQSVPAPAPNHS